MEASPVQLWIDALRSGEYEQGQYALKTAEGKYCCLGVACEVYQEVIGDLTVTPPRWDDPDLDTYQFDGDSQYLPDKVLEWLGLRSSRGVTYDGLSLASLNDSGADFHEIADRIESRPYGLFKDDVS